MIENEEGVRKAQQAIKYWREAIAKGGGSWLGAENARIEILKLHRAIAEFERGKSQTVTANAE